MLTNIKSQVNQNQNQNISVKRNGLELEEFNNNY